MSSYVIIELSTSLDVSYGAPVNPVMGETMFIPVGGGKAAESPIDYATLTLLDGRELEMTVQSNGLSVELPDDAPEGAANVLIVDEVGNEQTWQVLISGELPEQPRPSVPAGGLPTITEGRSWDSSRAVCSSRWRISSGPRPLATRARVRSRARAGRRDIAVSTARAHVTSAYRVRGALETSAALRASSTAVITKRPEGPGEEDDLLLLGIL